MNKWKEFILDVLGFLNKFFAFFVGVMAGAYTVANSPQLMGEFYQSGYGSVVASAILWLIISVTESTLEWWWNRQKAETA